MVLVSIQVPNITFIPPFEALQVRGESPNLKPTTVVLAELLQTSVLLQILGNWKQLGIPETA